MTDSSESASPSIVRQYWWAFALGAALFITLLLLAVTAAMLLFERNRQDAVAVTPDSSSEVLSDESQGVESNRPVLTGAVVVLMHVGFDGLPDEHGRREPWRRPDEGGTCQGPEESRYQHGAEVTVTDGGGSVVGIGALGGGTIATRTLGSVAEWERRESRIDSVYRSRSTITEDPLKRAEYDLERAELAVKDYDRRVAGQMPPPFEGYEFVPVYCALQFAIEVPASDFYRLTIGGAQPVTFAAVELEANDWHVELGDTRAETSPVSAPTPTPTSVPPTTEAEGEEADASGDRKGPSWRETYYLALLRDVSEFHKARDMDDDVLLDVGYAICGYFDVGNDDIPLLVEEQMASGGMTWEDAAAEVITAVMALCPEYEYLLDAAYD